MRGLLAKQRVELMSFEYAKNWNTNLFYSAQTGNSKRLTPDHLKELDRDPWQKERTLEEFQKTFAAAGYDTYLLHGAKLKVRSPTNHEVMERRKVVTMVPVYGKFFNRKDTEICLRRHHFKQPFCWNDLLVVRRGNTDLKQRLLQKFHGGRDIFKNCSCF